ncbi:DNA cytosine methyltransferase [Pseudomonas sp. LTJR-52]|uniref:DNA cytosine methyltransferase n=1 Tax=Pseudomonas sp. LTJR-52 TaxID=2479392 RepID=UPI000EFA4DD6|nr:DNA cytosine methyltransferase [Pseudomonas sp. LTJR-52]AYN94388.1 DNA cytosine methyltransferase [Pseudomonas sp. LTJR-52]
MPAAYYNEIDPYAGQWLRNLIAAGHIAPGDVDERSIEDVRPDDLKGYTQCHFFAGIGVWSLALRRAGWPDELPVWTGSCPCQPFSAAGKGAGFDDERHLWPTFYWLIAECRPPIVFGEQVASKDADPWIDLVQADLEAVDYAVGALPFPSAGVGAPHIRDRLYWVADTSSERRQQDSRSSSSNEETNGRERWHVIAQKGNNIPSGDGEISGYGPIRPVNGFWRDADWLRCRDGKWRPVESGTFPLANGSPARVGRLRAYGNAINAQAAQVFIEAVMESMP